LAVLETEPDVLAEKRKLRKSLFRWDLVFFTVAAILALDTIGAVSGQGAQAVFWVIVSGITFLIPYGLLTAELGTTFPVEGAVYEWVRLAFGHLAGAVTAVMYWISNPVWLGGTLAVTAIAALDAFWDKPFGGLANNGLLEFIVGFLFIWIAVTWNILSLRYMKWVPNLGAIVRLAAVALFGLLVIIGGVNHGFAGTLSGWQPTYSVFIGVIGILVFAWIGFELSTNASEEMEDPQKDVPRMVGLSGILSVLGYLVLIVGVLVVLAPKDLSNVSGFVSAYQTVVSQAIGGTAANVLNGIVGLAFVFSLLTSGTVWLMGADRMMAIGALAGSGPRALGRFSSRFGTPVPVNVLSGVLATIFLLANVIVNHAFAGGSLAALFGVVLAIAISTTTFSYIFAFPALVILRYKYPNARRPYRVPGGMVGAWIVMLLTWLYVVAATVFSLWPGLFTSSVLGPQTYSGVSLDRAPFEISVLVTMAIIIAIGVVFYIIGRGHAVHDRWPEEGVTADRREPAGVQRA
jgi:amino acid transporter